MIITKWQYRADTAANWTASNPVLAAGEVGIEKDTQGVKVGDGLSTWAALPYLFPAGGTVPAIGALITAALPTRATDAGNSSSVALGNGGTFVGTWKSTAGLGRFDIDLTNAATLNLVVEHSDDGVNAVAADTETWPASAATHATFPTPCKRKWYRVSMTDTGGGGAVTLLTTADPRSTPLTVIEGPTTSDVNAGVDAAFTRPLGARWVTCSAGVIGAPFYPTASPRLRDAGGNVLGRDQLAMGRMQRLPATCVELKYENIDGNPARVTRTWYA